MDQCFIVDCIVQKDQTIVLDGEKYLEGFPPKPASCNESLHLFIYLPSGGILAMMASPQKKLKSLKEDIEKVAGVPIKMQVIINAGRILENKKTLHQSKIHDGASLFVRLRLVGGMIEPSEEISPLHSLEVLIINASNHITFGTKFDSNNNTRLIPDNFVCRIYSNNGVGTGFAFRSKGGELMIMTVKHVLFSPITPASSHYGVCFKHDQSKKLHKNVFEKVANGKHQCRADIYRAMPANVNFISNADQRDPVTGELYGLVDDIAALTVYDFCICGNPLAPLASLNLTLPKMSDPPNKDEIVTLLGFPGMIADRNVVLPQRPDIDDAEVNNALLQMKPYCLIVSEGIMNSISDLLAITNSSIGGMSGSPLMYHDGTEWCVCGILLGGPAVCGHRELLDLIALREKGEPEQVILSETSKILQMQPAAIFNGCSPLMLYYHYPKDWKNTAVGFYYSLIRAHCCFAINQGNATFASTMNHNLAYRVLDFWKAII